MSKSKKKQPADRAPQSGRKKGLQLFAVLAADGLVVIAAVVLYVGKQKGRQGVKDRVTPRSPVKAEEAKGDMNKLLGRWLRPDGGYIIEISKILANGRLDTRYLNPRPINVSVAEASQRKEDKGFH